MKQIITFTNPQANEVNGYLLINDKRAILIDGGLSNVQIIQYLDAHQIMLTDILLTHFHYDHSFGSFELAHQLQATIHLHELDHQCLLQPGLNPHHNTAQLALINNGSHFINYDLFITNKTVELNGFHISFVVVHGHTPGSTFYAVDHQWLFVGDTLFKTKLGFHNAMFKEDDSPLKHLLTTTCDDHVFFQSIALIFKDYHDYLIYPGHWETGFKIDDVLNNHNHPYHWIDKT